MSGQDFDFIVHCTCGADGDPLNCTCPDVTHGDDIVEPSNAAGAPVNAAAAPVNAAAAPLPDGWTVYDMDGSTVYKNNSTGTYQKHIPTEDATTDDNTGAQVNMFDETSGWGRFKNGAGEYYYVNANDHTDIRDTDPTVPAPVAAPAAAVAAQVNRSAAAPAAAVPQQDSELRDGWNSTVDTNGDIYYYNKTTSTYAKPSNDLPEGWFEKQSTGGKTYYINSDKTASMWDKPTTPYVPVVGGRRRRMTRGRSKGRRSTRRVSARRTTRRSNVRHRAGTRRRL